MNMYFYFLIILSLFFLLKSEETPEPKLEPNENNNDEAFE